MRKAWEFHDVLGTLGVALHVLMYFLLQTGRITLMKSNFLVWNAVGSMLVLISLAYEFNLSAALAEGFLLAISLYAFVRGIRAAYIGNREF